MPAVIRVSSMSRGRVRNIAPKAERIYNGHTYHSKAEAMKAAELDLMVRCGRIEAWFPQDPLQIRVNGHFICDVVVDFRVQETREKSYYVETKGHRTEVYRLKLKLLKACYPGIDYRIEDVA